MRLRFTILGHEVWCLEFDQQDPAELLAEAIAELTEPSGISGGETHDFTLDSNPPNPSGEEPWDEAKKFGFS